MSNPQSTANSQDITIHVPMTLKRRSGRREVTIPDDAQLEQRSTPDYHEALVIAISRAHRWKKLLDEGRFSSVAQMARVLKMNRYCVARLLRMTLLAPDIIVAILDGTEPDGLSLNGLVGEIPNTWEEQLAAYGFATRV